MERLVKCRPYPVLGRWMREIGATAPWLPNRFFSCQTIWPSTATKVSFTEFHAVRRVDLSTGIITYYAGQPNFGGYSGDGGPARDAQLEQPWGLVFDTEEDLYIADAGNQRIRRVDRDTRIITTIAGTGASGFTGDGGPLCSSQMLAMAGSGGLTRPRGSSRPSPVEAPLARTGQPHWISTS